MKTRAQKREQQLRIAAAKTEKRRRRSELLREVAEAFSYGSPIAGKRYPSLQDVEHMSLDFLRSKLTKGTPFEPVPERLRQLGYPTLPTVGAVMDRLSLSQEDVAFIAGELVQGPDVLGAYMGGHLRYLTQRSFTDWLSDFVSDAKQRAAQFGLVFVRNA